MKTTILFFALLITITLAGYFAGRQDTKENLQNYVIQELSAGHYTVTTLDKNGFVDEAEDISIDEVNIIVNSKNSKP